ncbi:DNA polymerase epsilon noncatalytic subunit [Spizellomyces punctatus DAOM BR117]|uniref:DNA polymerase epsilon subunit n=1 Tax=Spizellomyces punctatus (strain DAOM BR117) TaxID=645134 RepID=A0A0L0HVQ0_SPIPD|nr:DNA polymerase epsilon noncatalytic subunit [Spizellomyces punctatus DAOM BR117]KND04980.1 hypothetical protein SPPG_00664 [Spizellomyces punctatus DAOM BR117]|eukprot:XP_016613019.1 hypothetical protein SPPG_00664 [Spizellomyces punctatus DAOM BR117]
MSSFKTQIYRILTKKHGLTLKTEALKYLEDVVAELPNEQLAETLDYIALSYTQQQETRKLLVDRASLEEVVQNIFRKSAINQALENAVSASSNGDSEAVGGMVGEISIEDIAGYLHVIDAFSTPRWKWRPDSKQFTRSHEKPRLLAPPAAKAVAFRDRYDILKQRVLRNDAFRPSTFTRTGDHFEITSIKNLQGHKPGSYLLLGMLTTIEEGKYHLEDPDGLIEIHLNGKIDKGVGLFCLNCFVLAEGLYTEDRIFKVRTLGMPLPETRQKSLSAFGHNVNFFGGPSAGDDQMVLENIEVNMTDVIFVIISDVWLDQPRVVMKLRRLFEGFSSTSSAPPLAFILIGNFMSIPYLYEGQHHEPYKQCFNTLADLLSDFRDLAQTSRFIFVPGPQDPWGAKTLPRPSIPKYYTERIRSKLPKAMFMSNPCRIKYCTQEIVIFRDDIVKRMRRGSIVPPREDVDVSLERHLVATLIDQAHLCPLPPAARPTYWGYDHALRLYPQPHLLVLADKHESYSVDYEGCKCINPGSFGGAEFEFMVYHPATKSCQASKIT